MKTSLIVIVGLLAFMEFVQAMELPIDLEQVSRAFDIPVNDIRITVKTDEVASRYGNSVYSASLFEFESDVNVSMQVIVTKGHFLLTDALRSKLEGEPALVEKLDLDNGGTAFVGIEGLGSGAEGYVAIAYLPLKNLDFRMRVIVTNDGVSAGDVSQYSVMRSSPLLLKALRTLAISSSASLSGNTENSSESMEEVKQRMKSSEEMNLNARIVKKANLKEGYSHMYTEHNEQTWKFLYLALSGICLLTIGFIWVKRKKLNHQ